MWRVLVDQPHDNILLCQIQDTVAAYGGSRPCKCCHLSLQCVNPVLRRLTNSGTITNGWEVNTDAETQRCAMCLKQKLSIAQGTDLANVSNSPAFLQLGAYLNAGRNHKDSKEAIVNRYELTHVDTLNHWVVWFVELINVFTCTMWNKFQSTNHSGNEDGCQRAWPRASQVRVMRVSHRHGQGRCIRPQATGHTWDHTVRLGWKLPPSTAQVMIVSDGWAATKPVPWATLGLRHEHCNHSRKVNTPRCFASRCLKRTSAADRQRMLVNKNGFHSSNVESLFNEIR